MATRKRVCVIGCGAAGLAAARHLVAAPDLFETVVFEQTSSLGGTWVFTDQVGKDQYGLPVHTSMYRSLRTNLPKEVMGYPDFPIPDFEEDRSYLKASEILDFLNVYANRFGVLKSVKFLHHVKLVEPLEDGSFKWKVTVIDLPKQEETTSIFDAVMVCNGHYHTPMYPALKGIETFPGEQLHSHDYRDPSYFTGKRVAVIGAGPSGIDLSLEIASTASKVILSRHKDGDVIRNVLPANALIKYDITEVEGSLVRFEDDSVEDVDTIFYCTGYKYSFPFLSEKCGVKVIDNCIQPLYKHLIHIEYPMLCLVGVPFYVCAFSLFDLQVRFFLKVLTGELILPSQSEMKADTEKEMDKRRQNGLKIKQFHMMGPMQGDYYTDLAALGNLDPLPQVLADLHTFSSKRQLDNLAKFRDDVYKIIDEKTFIKVK